jgi:undecaprenyl phosphate N,N'-diacetylbacillosamine 1-phosphate transferase
MNNRKPIYHFCKRLFDIVVSLMVLIILSPIILLLIVGLFVSQGGAFFQQKRPGLHGELFTVIKFKTMSDQTDENGELLADVDRLTKIGRFVRKTSLDELPQLLNVLSGKMSLVGPRPLLVEYLTRYNETQMRRHEVKPGITGWAQINGRNTLSWDQKFKYDVWYVDNCSFILDLEIILKTIKRVFEQKGINTDGHATAVKFNGNG